MGDKIVIEFTDFCLAAPPNTYAGWLITTCEGNSYPSSFLDGGSVHQPFKRAKSARHKLYVSLVRNPADWLYDWSASGTLLAVNTPLNLLRYPDIGFEAVAERYLRLCPGAIGKMFNAFHADTYMRVEDQGEALVELLESFGKQITQIKPPPLTHIPPKYAQLRSMILSAENELCQRYDYY